LSRTLLSWSEPMFFPLRFRTMKQWLWRLLIMLAIAGVSVMGLRWLGRNMPLLEDLSVGLILGGVLVLIPDLFLMNRELWVDEGGVHCHVNGGKIQFNHNYPFSNIALIELVRPQDWERSPGRNQTGMLLHLLDQSQVVFGIPKSKKLETMATILHRHGLKVLLRDWEPTTADTRVRVEDEISLSDLKATTNDAEFLKLPAEEPKLNPLGVQIIGGLFGGGPLLVALIAMIWGFVHLWRSWNELSVLWRSAWGIGSFAVFILGFLFILYIGQFIENAYRIAKGRENLRTRLSPLLDVEDEDVFPVVLYNRDMWSNVISRSADFGFLQVNRRRRAIVFEGDIERWTIPLTALTVARIEEAAVGQEGAEPSEIRYFVVIGTDRDGTAWEIGLSRPRTAWGSDGPEPRKERTRQLFDELKTAISLV
jgi:hypothetical protein